MVIENPSLGLLGYIESLMLFKWQVVQSEPEVDGQFLSFEALRGSLFGPTQLFPGSVACRVETDLFLYVRHRGCKWVQSG